MKAMILAAGRGTRVRPISDTVPKPMIPVVHQPVMAFLVDLLRQHRFDEIVISTSYLAHEIENYFGDGERFGVKIAYSFEGYYRDGAEVAEGLGSAGGLKKVQEYSGFFDTTFGVFCGDAIVDLDLTEAVRQHRAKGSLATIILTNVPRSETERYGIVRTDEEGRIVQFQEKPRSEDAVSTTANTGIYIFEPEVLDHVPEGQPFDIGGQLFPLLAAKGLPFYGITMPLTWIDIGQTSDYWRAVQAVLRGDLKFFRMPGRELSPGIWGGINLSLDSALSVLKPPLYIGSSTSIAPGVTIIGPTVIGRNCAIESGARIEACVIGDYTRISGFANVSEKIVSGRFCVDRHGQNVDLAHTGYAFVVDDVRERREWTEDQKILMEFLRAKAWRRS
jgi:mannose-1-phosphate guanylyltransferase